jgi:UDP-N-acetylmuramoyl-tripeptide--D-alanyl-D-alanine ligase
VLAFSLAQRVDVRRLEHALEPDGTQLRMALPGSEIRVRLAIPGLHNVRNALAAAAAGTRVLVLGDMGEVGEQGAAFHDEVGRHARARGIEHLLAAGELARETVRAFGAGAEHFDDVGELATRARALATPRTTLLVKGSRFMRMERVVAALAEGAA